jgi:hypothetical protein
MRSVGEMNKERRTEVRTALRTRGPAVRPANGFALSSRHIYMTGKRDLRDQYKSFDSFACLCFRNTKQVFSRCTERLITTLAVHTPLLCYLVYSALGQCGKQSSFFFGLCVCVCVCVCRDGKELRPASRSTTRTHALITTHFRPNVLHFSLNFTRRRNV